MPLSTQYSWIVDDSDKAKKVRKILLMILYWVVAWFVLQAAINFSLQYIFKVRVAYTLWGLLFSSRGLTVTFRAYRKYGLVGAIYFIVFGCAVTTFIFACLFSYLFYRRERGGDISKTHGSAHFATEKEIRNAGFFNSRGDSIICGGWKNKKGESFFLKHCGPEHVLVVAPTRSGKGVSLIIPTLLTWTESVFVFDIKGENWLATAGYRSRELGQFCLRFEPTDPGNPSAIKKDIEIHLRQEIKSGKRKAMTDNEIVDYVNKFYDENKDHLGPARYNPLLEVHIGTEMETAEIQQIATMLVDPDGKGLEDYWAQAGFELMTGAITYECYQARQKGREPTLTGVRKQLTSGDIPVTLEDWQTNEVLTDEEAKHFAEIIPGRLPSNKVHPLVETVAQSMAQKQEKELSGVFSTANANLSLFVDPVVSKNTCNATFTVSSIVNSDRPVSLYVVIPPSDLARLRPLLRLFVIQVVNGLTRKMEKDPDTGKISSGHLHRLLLMLDEFPQLRKLDQLQTALAQIAGYGLKAYIITQSYTQLSDVYGKDETVSANCNVHIAFAPNDENSARILSDKCGKTTEIVGNTSESGEKYAHGLFGKKNQSTSYSAHERPLMYPDEVSQLTPPEKTGELIKTPGEILVFAAGYPVIRGVQTLWFKNPEWVRRHDIDAPNININLKQRLASIRILCEHWQKAHEGATKEEFVAAKDKHEMLMQLDTKVLEKWYNPVLRKNPEAITEITILEQQMIQEAKNKKLQKQNKENLQKLQEQKEGELAGSEITENSNSEDYSTQNAASGDMDDI